MNRQKTIIGVVGYIENILENRPFITADECIREAIIASGGIPIVIMPTQNMHYDPDINPSEVRRLNEEEKCDLESQLDLCDGIIFPGGAKWYEHHEYLFNLALDKNKSILGICLGMQMMVAAINRKHGNIEYRNEKNDTFIDHKNTPNNEYAHSIKIKDNTILKNIIGSNEIQVNSRHNYHIGDKLDFIISSYADDGIPESIEMPNKTFVIGVQWHPEKLFSFDINSKKIFSEFVKSCKKD